MTLQHVIWLLIGLIMVAWTMVLIVFFFTKHFKGKFINEQLGKVMVDKRNRLVIFKNGESYTHPIEIQLDNYLKCCNIIRSSGNKNTFGWTGSSFKISYISNTLRHNFEGWSVSTNEIRIGCQRMSEIEFNKIYNYVNSKFNPNEQL